MSDLNETTVQSEGDLKKSASVMWRQDLAHHPGVRRLEPKHRWHFVALVDAIAEAIAESILRELEGGDVEAQHHQ